ncbi:MAG: glycosyltransferase [Eubacterium sp.]|nr:glycosyltransferase [Eubacterium sp.]
MDANRKLTQLFKIYWPDNGGGIANVMESIADGFLCCRQEIIVCQDSRHKKSADEIYHGVAVRRSRQLFTVASTPVSLRFLLDVKKRTRDSDFVICHFPYPMADLAILLGWYRGKLIVWWHCGIEKYKRLMPFYRPLVRHTLKKADRIFVSSKGNLVHCEMLRPFREKCTVIPFSVSDGYLQRGRKYVLNQQEAAKPVSEKQDTLLKKKNEIGILFIGRLVWYKGCEVLIRAFAKMKEKNRCRLVLVGGGPLEQELKALASYLAPGRIEFAGMVSEEEKLQRLEACDFLVLPSVSKAEAFGLVQIEAMAFGKPVINTKLPSGVPYVSVDGVTGKTVRAGHVRELAEAMDLLAQDDAIRQEYGRNAWERVNREYAREVMVARYEKVFGELLGESRQKKSRMEGCRGQVR